jgi:hypothetical protein
MPREGLFGLFVHSRLEPVWVQTLAVREETSMRLSEIILLVLFLMVFVIVPIIFTQFGKRRPAGISNLQVCPDCGAHNYKAKERCYCCGRRFLSPQPDGADPVQIQRVKQADDSGMSRGVEPLDLQKVAGTLQRADKAGRS